LSRSGSDSQGNSDLRKITRNPGTVAGNASPHAAAEASAIVNT
jgi:hypothetical protein